MCLLRINEGVNTMPKFQNEKNWIALIDMIQIRYQLKIDLIQKVKI